MSIISKSPRKVLLTAHAAALEALPESARRNHPQKFTPHPLFAGLVLRAFHNVDYRGVEAIRVDSPAWGSIGKVGHGSMGLVFERQISAGTAALGVQLCYTARNPFAGLAART